MATQEELENRSNSRYEQMWMSHEPVYAHVQKQRNYSDPRAHWAAIVIQRAYRSYRLSRKFKGLKSLQYNHLDVLILQAAGLTLEGSPRLGRPAVRRIRKNYPSTQDTPLRRSRSLKDPERRSLDPFKDSRSKDDTEIDFLPPPPPFCVDAPPVAAAAGVPDMYHTRVQSSPAQLESEPALLEEEEDFPLPPPPPPYIPPPHLESDDEPLPPPPPPFDPNDPPPPPLSKPSTLSFLPSRNSCASTSSSISSVDSGYAHTPPHSRSWISSPRLMASPESNTSISNYAHPQQIYDIYVPPAQKKSVRIQDTHNYLPPPKQHINTLRPHVDDTIRKRQYRVGLNLFNQNPERGMEYLIRKNYVEYSPAAVAKFLIGRKGISKKMIGEYLTSLQRPFNMAVLHCFVHEIDFSGLHIDIALRILQQEVMLPGESQKIEKMVEVFSKRYIQCNQMFVASFKSTDTIFVLSYAMILLNTDLHSRAVRSSRRMKKEDFVRNLRGIDGGNDVDEDMLRGIFDRIRTNEFRAGADHQTQVSKVEENIRGDYDKAVGGRLAEPHRRLVCFCRLTEVPDMNTPKKNFVKKDALHQRGVFLFNDLLVVTKSLAKKKSLHQYRYCVSLRDLRVNTFSTSLYVHGIQIQDRFSGKVISTFDGKSESDQKRFVHDLQESVSETIEMDRARLYFDDTEEEEML
nr:LOW QUALITY PROTEIN: IQ motif and SEC7 domain-containing protein 1-like [Lepeophtheirus salmonis]